MPVPERRKDEKEQEFINRCMGDPTMVKEYKDAKQRAAICYSQARKKVKGEDKHKPDTGDDDDMEEGGEDASGQATGEEPRSVRLTGPVRFDFEA